MKNDILNQFPQVLELKKQNIVYLDSAATSLKLESVAKAQYDFDTKFNSNVHRGTHSLSVNATNKYEEARTSTAQYLGCSHRQIVFTKGTTEAINAIANHYKTKLNKNDSILITEMEHHANLLPWQEVSRVTGAKLLVAPLNDVGEVDLESLTKILAENSVKVFSCCHCSNTLGTLNPLDKFSKLCKEYGAEFVVDAAQSVTFLKPNVESIDCDYFAFSTHKLFGAFGVGILYCKDIDSFSPYQLGGGIIQDVTFSSHTLLDGPQKLEAGTPNISGVLSLLPLIDFLNSLNFSEVYKHEQDLLKLAFNELSALKGFRPVGLSQTRVNILSFNFEGIHPNDLCELLNEQGLALRSGHHCTQPLLKKLGIQRSARASFSLYNTQEDVLKLVSGIKKALEILK